MRAFVLECVVWLCCVFCVVDVVYVRDVFMWSCLCVVWLVCGVGGKCCVCVGGGVVCLCVLCFVGCVLCVLSGERGACV